MTTPSTDMLLPEELINAFNLLPAPTPRRSYSTALQLRDAEDRLAEAERMIAEQERRIRLLEEMADTDALTGLLNRRGFERFFGAELARMQRHNSDGGYLLLIDLDLFKQINDQYGHQAGDTCLRAIAKMLTGSTRIVDGAARFGGDEFAILLTQTDADRAAERIQTLRDLLNNIVVEWKGETLRLGASIGGAAVRRDSTLESAYREADKRLYMDKHNRKASK